MAEKKVTHNVTRTEGAKAAGTATKGTGSNGGKKNTVGLRIGAVLLWIAAIVCEVLALATIFEKITIQLPLAPLYIGIGFLVIDLILVIIGSQLWKKANHINPASEKNKFLFWLWNNMGVIVAAIAFLPFIILLLKDEKADKKTKTIGTAVAAVALLIAGVSSYDFNPVSAEQLEAANATDVVYWTAGGSVFHIDEDCSHLNRSLELTAGTVEEAQEAGKSRLCKTCEKRNAAALEAADVYEALPAAAIAPTDKLDPAA